MPAASEDYELIQLTDSEKIDFTREQNSPVWRGSLTTEQYVERDAVLEKSKSSISNTSKLLVFILRDKTKPEVHIASVEFLIRKSWSYTNIGDGQVDRKEVLSGCIGGVFTYPDFRGKGIARIMIDKLVKLAKEKLLGPDGFMYLYSEVGDYYVRNGFKSFEVPLVKLNFNKLNSENLGKSISDIDMSQYTMEKIKYHDSRELMQEYVTKFDGDLKALTAKDGKRRVTVIPTSYMVDWFHLRAKFVSSKLFYKEELDMNLRDLPYEEIQRKFHAIKPDVFGLKLLSNEGNVLGSIFWTYEWSKEEETDNTITNVSVLKIIMNSSQNQDQICQLLIVKMIEYLQDECHHEPHQNLKDLAIWQCELSGMVLQWLEKQLHAAANLENSSRSAILLNSKQENDMLANGDLIWEGNTKLPWF